MGGVKHIAGVRTYVAVDGGMPDNPRYALYWRHLPGGPGRQLGKRPRPWKPPSRANAAKAGIWWSKDAQIQPVETGDLLCVFSTGAYNYSMASNYNRIPRPPVVFLRQGKHRLAVQPGDL